MTSRDEIAKAVAQAVTKVTILGKSDKNAHAKYNFASIDKFLEMVNPIFGACGLFAHISMVDMATYEQKSQRGASTWAKFTFDITLYHSSGQSLPPARSMVCVPLTGAQASGSAQSYALKQFYRGLILIPTGDKDDPDFNSTASEIRPIKEGHDGDADQGLRNVAAGAVQNLNNAAAGAINQINGAETIDSLRTLFGGLHKDVKAHPDVIKAKDERKAALEKQDQEGDGPLDDEIPHFENRGAQQ